MKKSLFKINSFNLIYFIIYCGLIIRFNTENVSDDVYRKIIIFVQLLGATIVFFILKKVVWLITNKNNFIANSFFNLLLTITIISHYFYTSKDNTLRNIVKHGVFYKNDSVKKLDFNHTKNLDSLLNHFHKKQPTKTNKNDK